MATIPVAIRFLAEKDASVDRIAGEVRGQLAGANVPISVSATTSGNSLADVQRLRTELEQVRVQAAGAGGELQKLRQSSDGIRQAADQAQRMATLGRELGVGLSVAGASMLGLAGASIQAASKFEQLQQQLVTLKGNSAEAAKTFEFARAIAAKSPFDVQGVTAAAVTLEAYKQKAEDTLPAVANLAAGMGKSISEAALVVGKATSGSLEGFESLRNEYGITTDELRKFGAQVNATGGILARSPAQIDLARTALLRIIQTRFGDAVERQSQTFAGAFSNLGDAIQNTGARIGQTLIPSGTSLIRIFTGVVDVIGKAPAPLLALAGAGLVAGGTLATLAGASTLAAAGLVAVNAQLAVAAEQSTAAALGLSLTSRALAGLGVAATGVVSALRFLVTNPIGLAISGTVLAVAAAVSAMNAYANASREAGNAIVDESHKVQGLIQDYRQLLDVVNSAGKRQGVSLNTGSGQGDFASALAKIRPDELAFSMQAAGKSVQDYRKAAEEASARSAVLRDRMRETIQAINEQKEANNALTSNQKLAIEDEKGRDREQEILAGKVQVLTDKLAEQRDEYGRLVAAGKGMSEVADVLDNLASRMTVVSRETQRASDFLGFAKQIGSTDALVAAQARLGEEIVANSRNAEIGQKTLNELNAEINSAKFADDKIKGNPALEAQKKALEDQFKAKVQDLAVTKELADRAHDAQDKIVADKEDTFRREKALHGKSLEEEIAFHQQLVRLYGQQGEAGVANQTQEIEKVAELQKKGHEQRLQDIKRNAGEELAAAKATRAEDGAGQTASSNVDAIDKQIAKIEKLRDANAKLIKQVPELKKLYDDALRNAGVDRAREVAKIPAENLKVLKDSIAQFSAEGITAAEKLANVERAITLTVAAKKQGLIDAVSAERELVGLTHQEADLQRQITAERNQRQAGLRGQEIQAQESQLQSLQSRKENGETRDENGKAIDRAILEGQQNRLKLQLQNVDAAKAAEVEAARGNAEAIADIERKYSYDRQQILGQETDRVYSELRKQTEAQRGELDKQDGRFRQSQNLRTTNGFGGSASPFTTNAGFGGGQGFQPSALSNFSDGFGRSFFGGTRAPSFNQARLQVQNTVQTIDRNRANAPGGGFRNAAESESAAPRITNNNSIQVNGSVHSFTDAEFDRNVLRVLAANKRSAERSPSKRK